MSKSFQQNKIKGLKKQIIQKIIEEKRRRRRKRHNPFLCFIRLQSGVTQGLPFEYNSVLFLKEKESKILSNGVHDYRNSRGSYMVTLFVILTPSFLLEISLFYKKIFWERIWYAPPIFLCNAPKILRLKYSLILR